MNIRMVSRTSRLTPVMAGLFFALATSLASAQAPESVVELSTVTERGSNSVLRLPGTVISKRDADISAELNGRLNWVAEVGDTVEKGEAVAIIDDHLLKLQLRNNEAQIKRISADIDYNKRQIERLQRLAEQNNMAKSELDLVESRLKMLVQDRTIAEVSRDRTLYDIERTEVSAPFSGIVVSREMTVGEYTSPGAALVRLVDTGELEISVNAPLRVARFNQSGTEVQIESDEQQVLTAIRSVIPVGDSRSRMMEVRIELQSGFWQIGEAVTVELANGVSEVSLSVPRDALVLRNNEVFVYTISEDNKAVKVPVIAGAGRGQNIAISGELFAGDPVVVRGAESLRDGQAVRVIRHHLAVD
jgi:RND family efflux transporter MFP subunit